MQGFLRVEADGEREPCSAIPCRAVPAAPSPTRSLRADFQSHRSLPWCRPWHGRCPAVIYHKGRKTSTMRLRVDRGSRLQPAGCWVS